jgi:hypothetical protein
MDAPELQGLHPVVQKRGRRMFSCLIVCWYYLVVGTESLKLHTTLMEDD